MENYIVKSFNRDHREMDAPQVYLSDKLTLAGGDVLYKYDIRLTKPNCDYIEPQAIHALEHVAACEIREHLANVWDLSPMGCMTGFYLTILNEPDIVRVTDAMKACLRTAAEVEEIPAANEVQCGNYRFLDREGMQSKVREILSKW